jgi:hypothetical protein
VRRNGKDGTPSKSPSLLKRETFKRMDRNKEEEK